MRLEVHSHAPRNIPGGKTQEEKNKPGGGAGKPDLAAPRKLGEASWPSVDGGEDPWDHAKAARWMLPAGQAVVRAGLLVWRKLPEAERAPARKRGILVLGVEGAWPDWLRGKEPAEIAATWRAQPPLWLLAGLPNLPAAQLAIEIGAQGPVESRRSREGNEVVISRTVRGWIRRGLRQVVVVYVQGEAARAELWSS